MFHTPVSRLPVTPMHAHRRPRSTAALGLAYPASLRNGPGATRRAPTPRRRPSRERRLTDFASVLRWHRHGATGRRREACRRVAATRTPRPLGVGGPRALEGHPRRRKPALITNGNNASMCVWLPIQHTVQAVYGHRPLEDAGRRRPAGLSSPSVRRTPFRVRRTPFRVRRTPFRVQRTPFRVRRTPFRVRRTPYRVQRTPFRVRRTPFRVRRTQRAARSASRGGESGRGMWPEVWAGCVVSATTGIGHRFRVLQRHGPAAQQQHVPSPLLSRPRLVSVAAAGPGPSGWESEAPVRFRRRHSDCTGCPIRLLRAGKCRPTNAVVPGATTGHRTPTVAGHSAAFWRRCRADAAVGPGRCAMALMGRRAHGPVTRGGGDRPQCKARPARVARSESLGTRPLVAQNPHSERWTVARARPARGLHGAGSAAARSIRPADLGGRFTHVDGEGRDGISGRTSH
jgi:hypothetical protein